jgi:hypothetical protein
MTTRYSPKTLYLRLTVFKRGAKIKLGVNEFHQGTRKAIIIQHTLS